MKTRARHIVMGTALAGGGVVSVLVAVHWGAVRDHVEAWHFQLTKETETIEPADQSFEFEWWRTRLPEFHSDPFRIGAVVRATQGSLLRRLANDSGAPVVMLLDFPWRARRQRQWSILFGEEVFSGEDSLQCLRKIGWRIVEQRFPKKAYVVLTTEDPLQEEIETPPAELEWGFSRPIIAPASPRAK